VQKKQINMSVRLWTSVSKILGSEIGHLSILFLY
jgi:hypothetical protein